MTDELEQRITQLEREVRQLRAKEGAIAAFNQYLYGIDTGFIPDILEYFIVKQVTMWFILDCQ